MKSQPTQAARMLFCGLSLVALWLVTLGVGGVVAQSRPMQSGPNGANSHRAGMLRSSKGMCIVVVGRISASK